MAKPRTGTIEPFTNAAGRLYYRGKIRLGDGSRERVDIDEPHCFDKQASRDFVLETQMLEDERGERLARKLGQPPPASTETVAAWGERWVKAREDKGYMSTRDDRGRIVTHVVPVIGSKPMAMVNRSDIERVVEVLDTKVKTGAMSWKTALNVWGIVTKMFDDAQNSKQRDLRVREDNPCDRVAAPDRGVHKSQQFCTRTNSSRSCAARTSRSTSADSSSSPCTSFHGQPSSRLWTGRTSTWSVASSTSTTPSTEPTGARRLRRRGGPAASPSRPTSSPFSPPCARSRAARGALSPCPGCVTSPRAFAAT